MGGGEANSWHCVSAKAYRTRRIVGTNVSAKAKPWFLDSRRNPSKPASRHHDNNQPSFFWLFFWLFFGLELEFFLRSGNLKEWGFFLGFFVLSLAGIDLGSLSKILRNSFIYFTPLFISC